MTESSTSNDQHIYHHNEPASPRLNLKVEKNSRGVNYEATVVGAESVEEAMQLIRQAIEALKSEYEASDPA